MITNLKQKTKSGKFHLKKVSNRSKNNLPLDKLAQLDTNLKKGVKSNKVKWQNKAKTKALSKVLSVRLANVKNSKIKKSAWNTYHCMDVMEIKEGVVNKANRCKNRWCPSCAMVYAGKLMNGYKSSIEAMTEPIFLTLTIVAVKSDDLGNAFEQMKDEYGRIIKTLKTRAKRGGNPFKHDAIRKLECNYNSIQRTFNPHFHILIDGKENGEMIKNEWLKRGKDLSPDAQKLTKADPKTVGSELFKYVTKTITKDEFIAEAQTRIFEELYRKRIYQAYGNVKQVKEEIEDHEPTPIDWKAQKYKEEVIWNQQIYDWYKENGEPLTDYIPTEEEKILINQLKLSKDE